MDKQERFNLAEQRLLAPGELDSQRIERLLGSLLGPHVDAADIYMQFSRREAWTLEDGIIKDPSYAIEQGAGLRAMSGEKQGFAYADELTMPTLLDASRAARAIARGSGNGKTAALQRGQSGRLYEPIDPGDGLRAEDKVALLQRLDTHARDMDSRVEQVIVSLNAVHEVILVACSDGTFVPDVRPLVRLGVQVIASQGKRREAASAGGGGRFGLDRLLAPGQAESIADEAVRQAITNLDACEAPAGAMPVVLGPGWPGVLLHEAVGHGLEGDFIRKGTSAFCGKLGERVASPLCTVVDDGSIDERRGSLNIDDEGVATQRNVLIEDGRLTGFLYDKRNARLAGVASTGNGRRESFAHLPMPRMTNTFMLAGESDPEEIIASVDRGLYAVNFGGGQVDITSGKFVFSASEAYLIEDGKLTAPVKGATLIGNGPDALTRVSMVGNDLELDPGIGVCGKDGQGVPVGVGQPTLKLDELVVGGTQ